MCAATVLSRSKLLERCSEKPATNTRSWLLRKSRRTPVFLCCFLDSMYHATVSFAADAVWKLIDQTVIPAVDAVTKVVKDYSDQITYVLKPGLEIRLGQKCLAVFVNLMGACWIRMKSTLDAFLGGHIFGIAHFKHINSQLHRTRFAATSHIPLLLVGSDELLPRNQIRTLTSC